MKKITKFAFTALAAALVLGNPAKAASDDVGADSFPAGSKMAQLAEAGTIKVGVQTQYPLIGLRTLNGYSGFDVEIAVLVAEQLGISRDDIEFVPVTTPTREPFLEQGKTDMIVAAYTILPQRQKVIDFAGPYIETPSGLLVQKGNPLGIDAFTDLVGKTLCGPAGSSQEAYFADTYPEIRKTMVFFDSSAKCAEAVLNGQVDASTTEVTILAALAAAHDGQLEVIPGLRYGTGGYGIGVKQTEDKTFCEWINKVLVKIEENGAWEKAYDETIGTVMPGAPTPPAVGGHCK